jgi:hypothetical protein
MSDRSAIFTGFPLPAETRASAAQSGRHSRCADSVPYETKRQQLARADEYLIDARMAGDALVAAFFAATKPKEREQKRTALGVLVKRSFENVIDLDADTALRAEVNALREKGVVPFHWEIEFPEVFRKGGFDAIVGNPPFAGKNTLSESNADGYLDWLKVLHEQSHGNSDLVAHFFRRAFTLLRPHGRFGLIATNTIGQGDTRSTGLRWICTHGGTIYKARKRLRWPGQAAVVVSVVHVAKDKLAGPYLLDNREVPIITAYLFHAGGHEDPTRLKANEDKSFQGSIVLGMGFTFDDIGNEGEATPLAEMQLLIARDPRNRDRIFPYIGGKEVTTSPTHTHHRYAINSRIGRCGVMMSELAGRTRAKASAMNGYTSASCRAITPASSLPTFRTCWRS